MTTIQCQIVQLRHNRLVMEYPNSTLPLPYSLITFFYNLSYLTQGDLGRNDPPNLTETTKAERTQGQNDPGPPLQQHILLQQKRN